MRILLIVLQFINKLTVMYIFYEDGEQEQKQEQEQRQKEEQVVSLLSNCSREGAGGSSSEQHRDMLLRP